MEYYKLLKKGFTGVILVSFFSSTAFGANINNPKSMDGFSVADDLKVKGTGTEYVVGQTPDAVMMKVNIWGGVRMPGIYHVPVGTDLLSMISFAGGPSQVAELDDVHIKRNVEAKTVAMSVDVDDLINGKDVENPLLRVNDIVVIPESKPAVSQNTMLILAAVGAMASLALTAVVLTRNK